MVNQPSTIGLRVIAGTDDRDKVVIDLDVTMCRMDLLETPDEKAFRAEARVWLAANVPSEPLPSFDTEEGFALHREWEARLASDRWSAVSWPVEYGGRGADYIKWLIFEEEYWRSGAPGRVSQNGIFLLGPTIMDVGSDEQKARFLPAMAQGVQVWAQAWSEPDAGSDMASIRSKGTLSDDGSEWILNGQKIWASRAVWSDWCFGIFRTDPESSRHRFDIHPAPVGHAGSNGSSDCAA